jgi:hypothetical protein
VLQEFLTATSGDPDSFACYGHPIFPHFPEIDNPKLDGKPLLLSFCCCGLEQLASLIALQITS